MNTHDSNRGGQHPEPSPCNCNQDDSNPTQMMINKERNKYCLELYAAKGAASQQETKFIGENEIYNEKKCLFHNTEENYLRFRNLEITIGTEVTTTSDALKGNVDKLKKWNSDLYGILKKLSKSIKDTKEKFKEVKDAGCKLESSIHDPCNISQWKILTGKNSESCTDPVVNPHPGCEKAHEAIEDLICKPKGLIKDIGYLLQSSADVVGIQLFSNIDTLEPLHKDLDKYSKDFEKNISDVLKTRETDMKNLQAELIKSVKDITKSALDRSSLRSEFEGFYDSVDYMCCPVCDCLDPKSDDDCGDQNKGKTADNSTKDCYCDCEPRLKDCEDEICRICEDVEKAFCCTNEVSIDPPKGCCDD